MHPPRLCICETGLPGPKQVLESTERTAGWILPSTPYQREKAQRTYPAHAPTTAGGWQGTEPQAKPSDFGLPALGKMTGPGPHSCESQLAAEARCPVLASPSDGSLALSGADRPLALLPTFMFWTGFNNSLWISATSSGQPA